MILRRRGKQAYFIIGLRDTQTPTNNPVLDETVIVSVRRASDDKWWNFTDEAWETVVGGYGSLAAGHKASLSDKRDGAYASFWDQPSADDTAIRDYMVLYYVTSSGSFQGMLYHQVWSFVPAIWYQVDEPSEAFSQVTEDGVAWSQVAEPAEGFSQGTEPSASWSQVVEPLIAEEL